MSAPSPLQPRQRWQIVFSRAEPALRMRQQEVVAEFARAFGEAGLPLSTTAAQRPRPRVSVAAGLPTGLEGREEVLEAFFDELLPVERILAAGEHLPDGLSILTARDVWHGFPSAASQVRAAEYRVTVHSQSPLTADELRGAVVRLLGAESLSGRRRRGETERRSDVREADLRPLIQDVEVEEIAEGGASATLRMVLGVDRNGAARPEDVVAAMDLPLRPARVVRMRLLFVDTPPSSRVE